ncbi:hypothetical protein I316_06223 [Kwoniella heveanensis BCC8398]|uniref:NYN domain-containing protein n=1 Tax=Kwoniella heveanensis BCC8398 TaxID=1296120 RepID=A0A1B9GM02_9TREE|nr:hypothetical protein I316_06223 [Kwoniella heveanensis BCC8398]
MDDSFEIEEDLDPSILGLALHDEHTSKQVNGRQTVDAKDCIDSIVYPVANPNMRSDSSTPSSPFLTDVKSPLNANPLVVNPAAATPPWTALDLLRSIAGSYVSADWVPPNSTGGANTLYEEYANVAVSPYIPLQEDVISVDNDAGNRGDGPIARDFVEDQPKSTSEAPAPENGSIEMEKTESYVSTAPSINMNPPEKLDIIESEATVLSQPRLHVTWVRTRLPGRRRYRTGIRVHRAPVVVEAPAETDEETNITDNEIASQISTAPARPELTTQFQRDFSDAFGRDSLDKIEQQAKLDSTSGNLAPQTIRDLFPALGDVQSATKIANVIRRQLGLPLLSNTKSDKIALRRALAKMRENLYREMIVALAMPLAPTSVETDDEEGKAEKEAVTLTPTALTILGSKMPKVFTAEKGLIKAFLANDNENAYGEKKGKVVWQGGVGRMLGKGDGGFRGTVNTDGLCHIYVDHSNILHGLLHHLYANPSDALPPRHLRTLSLPAMSLLLRRGRPTPPGSLHLVASSPLHQSLDPLVRLGWEVSVLKRVELYEDEVEDPNSMRVSARPQARISGHNDVGLRRYREQGVDEILHLKILQVINEKGFSAERGSTLILATGDARGGQFNRDGFPGAVREALKRGWNVELWSFTAGLSRAWKETARRERWHELGKFTIWALDDWAEQLVEVGDEDEL